MTAEIRSPIFKTRQAAATYRDRNHEYTYDNGRVSVVPYAYSGAIRWIMVLVRP